MNARRGHVGDEVRRVVVPAWDLHDRVERLLTDASRRRTPGCGRRSRGCGMMERAILRLHSRLTPREVTRLQEGEG